MVWPLVCACAPSGRSNVEIFRDYGINCTYSLSPTAREVRNGIMLIKAAYAIRGRPGYVRSDNGLHLEQCACNFFCRKATAAGFRPITVGQADHIVQVVLRAGSKDDP